MRTTTYLAIAGIVIASALLALLSGPPPTRAATEPRVGLVVQFAPGQVQTSCVPYQEGMSGLDVLRSSTYSATLELDTSFGPLGAAVCKLGNTGCAISQGEACFCQSSYWAYYRLSAGKWQASPAGAGSVKAQPGGVEGWSWGAGGSGGAPPARSFAEICGAARVWLPLLQRS